MGVIPVSLVPGLQLAAVLVAGVVSIRLCYLLLLSPLSRFPGPPLAKITNAYRAFRTWMGRIDLEHLDWHKTYGSAVRIGPNTIMLNDPDLIKVVFTTKGLWQKSEMYKPNEALVDGKRVPNMFNTRDEAYHTMANKPVKPLYSLSRVQEIEPLVNESLEELMRHFDRKFADKKDAVCMWDDWMAWWAWDTMFNITYGEPMGFMEKEDDIVNFITAATEGQYYYSAISQIPWLDNWLDKNPVMRIGPEPVAKGVGVTFMKLMAHMQKKAEGKEQKDGDNNGRCELYADKFLRLKQTHPDVVDDNLVFQYSLFNMLAGGDSTASLLRAATYHLSKNPACYSLLQRELDGANIPCIPANYKDVSHLPYLTAVIREVMRINPGVSQTLERIVPKEGFSLPDGRYIPGGARVGIDPSVIMKNVPIFGPEDTMEFHPERWLQREDESDADFEARSRKMVSTLDFIFGHGKRMCTGRYLAQVEAYKFLATMYSVYDIKLKNPSHEWKYRAAWFVFQTDIPVVISRRKRD